MLFEAIESHYKTNLSEENAHREHLLIAKSLLEKFIEKNRNTIIEPLQSADKGLIRDDMINTFTDFERESGASNSIGVKSDSYEYEILKPYPRMTDFTIQNIPDDIFYRLVSIFFNPNKYSNIGISHNMSRQFFSDINSLLYNTTVSYSGTPYFFGTTQFYRDLFLRAYNKSEELLASLDE